MSPGVSNHGAPEAWAVRCLNLMRYLCRLPMYNPTSFISISLLAGLITPINVATYRLR